MASTADNTSTAAPSDGLSGLAQSQIDKAKAFAKARPWAVGTLAAILGLATLNTLRGRS